MELENTTLSEVTKPRKNKCCLFFHIWILPLDFQICVSNLACLEGQETRKESLGGRSGVGGDYVTGPRPLHK